MNIIAPIIFGLPLIYYYFILEKPIREKIQIKKPSYYKLLAYQKEFGNNDTELNKKKMITLLQEFYCKIN